MMPTPLYDPFTNRFKIGPHLTCKLSGLAGYTCSACGLYFTAGTFAPVCLATAPAPTPQTVSWIAPPPAPPAPALDPFARLPAAVRVESYIKRTEANTCDCGGFKCRTTHAHWCKWKQLQDADYETKRKLDELAKSGGKQ